jgi:Ca2+-binding RTX toxin-like protein
MSELSFSDVINSKNLQTALDFLTQEYTANRTLNQTQLTQLLEAMEARVAGSEVTLLYSGVINDTRMWKIAEKIGVDSDGKVATINQSGVGQLLNSSQFINAATKLAISDGLAPNELLWGEDANGNRINNTSFSDVASRHFVSNGEGAVRFLTDPNANPDGVLAKTEIPAVYDNQNYTSIENFSRADFDARVAALEGTGLSTTQALEELRMTAIAPKAAASYQLLDIVKVDGEVTDVGTNDYFHEHTNIPKTYIPDDTPGKIPLSSITDINFKLWVKNADILVKELGDHLHGPVGWIINGVLLSVVVTDAHAQGGVEAAKDAAYQWTLDNIEGEVGAAGAMLIYGGLITAGVLTAPVSFTAGLLTSLAIGIVGGVAGEELLDLDELLGNLGITSRDDLEITITINGEPQTVIINDILHYGINGYETTRIYGTNTFGDIVDFTPDFISANENIIYMDGSNSADDIIQGNNQNNILNGHGGDDTILGGDGSDTIVGSTGEDVIDGGSNEDWIDYSALDNDITINLLTHTAHIDYTFNDDDQVLYNIENIKTGDGNDSIIGDSTDNTFISTSGNDTLQGGLGADVLDGGADNDELYGGSGHDSYYFDGNFGDDVVADINAGDKIYINGVVLNGMAEATSANPDDYVNGAYGDFTLDGYDLTYSSGVMTITVAGQGSIALQGWRNGDFGIVINPPQEYNPVFNDEVYLLQNYGSEVTFIDGYYSTVATMVGSMGDDGMASPGIITRPIGSYMVDYTVYRVFGLLGNDTITGTSHNELLVGGEGNDFIEGGGGLDEIYGGADNSTLYGGAGDDNIFLSTRDNLVDGGDGNDNIDGGTGKITVYGGMGNDEITVGGYENLIYGGDGNDSIGISGGRSTINGGDGNDIIYGSDRDDAIEGGAQNDTINASYGDDTLQGGQGDDSLIGGIGADHFMFSADSGAIDVITDFAVGEDKIDLTAMAGVSFISLSLNNNGGNAIIGLGNGQSIQLSGVNSGSLQASDFIFAPHVNTASVAQEDAYTLDEAATLSIDVLSGVLANDSDAENDALTAILVSDVSHGTLSLNSDGSFSYTHNGSNHFSDSFSYKTNDGTEDSNTVNVSFTIIPINSIQGTSGDDSLNGGNGDDYIIAGNGNDRVYAGAGNDTIFGGEGNDSLFGEDGNDSIDAGDGQNSINGANGNDFIIAGSGNDNVTVQGGYNTIYGGEGDNSITSNGWDWITTGSGNDTIHGGTSNAVDTIDAGDGNNVVTSTNSYVTVGGGHDTVTLLGTSYASSYGDVVSGAGDDTINAGSGNITIDAGAGDDSISFVQGAVTLNAGDGNDELSISSDFRGESFINLGSGANVINQNYTMIYTNSRGTVIGGEGADSIKIYFDYATIHGGEGNDTITTGNGDDVIYAGDENDTINAAGGYNTIYGGEGNNSITSNGWDWITTGSGNDTIHGGTSTAGDSINAGDGNNVVTASTNSYVTVGGGHDTVTLLGISYASSYGDVVSGAGDDTINAGSGNITIDAGAGDDSISFVRGSLSVNAGDGNDDVTITSYLHGNNIVELGDGLNVLTHTVSSEISGSKATVSGGEDDDYIQFKTNYSTVTGGAGNDTIYTWDGHDLIYGGDGDDFIDMNGGTDTVYGGAGNDTLIAYYGNKIITGGNGADTIDAGSGDEIFVYENLSDSTDMLTDYIMDFDQGDDLINVSALGFTGIQAGSANGTILGYSIVGGNTIIEADASDFSIVLNGGYSLTATDFVFT